MKRPVHKYRFYSAALLLSIVLVGCSGTLEIGIERTPPPDHAATATIEALIADNARLATQVATLASPTPSMPDLGRLAYVQGGDIWVKVLSGATFRAQRLTTDGRNREPLWSSSGRWLAFRKERQTAVVQAVPCDIPKSRAEACFDRVTVLQRQVWLIEADGSGAHPLNEGGTVENFAWAPTSDRLAYVTASGELQTINADGTDLTILVPSSPPNHGPGRLGNIAWNPDGTWIAYEWQTLSPDSSSTYQALWQVSVDGKEQAELYPGNLPKKGEAILAGWSPQGKYVFFWQSESRTAPLMEGVSLFRVPVEKDPPAGSTPIKQSSQVMLAYTDFVTSAPPNTNWGVQESVALAVGGGPNTWMNKRIEVDGLPRTPDSMAATSPAWSPDGTHLAYAAMPAQSDLSTGELTLQELMPRHIWVINTWGELQPRQLTDSPTYYDDRPLWSADGNSILFARMDIKGQATLWLIPAVGGAPSQIVGELTPAPDPFGFYGHLDWNDLFDWWRGPTGLPVPSLQGPPTPGPT